MCLDYDKTTDYRIEYEDLFQEASLKLFEIYKNNRPLDINFSLKIVRDHLINYIKKNKVNSTRRVGRVGGNSFKVFGRKANNINK